MTTLLDLVIMLTPPPEDAPAGTIALFSLQYGSLNATPPAPLADPLTDREREELRWYLEEYWKWPYEGFRQRAQGVEQSLEAIGRRLYDAITWSREAVRAVDAWRTVAAKQRRISIVSGVPAALNLPWELLRDEQGYLVLRARNPVSLVRRLPQGEGLPEQEPFALPLRVLLVTARPEDAGFVDPRGIARELLDEVARRDDKDNAPPIEVEFLRPPTLRALTERLGNTKLPPVHVLHFDGHGVFHTEQPSGDPLVMSGGGRGMLAFETTEGTLDLVPAERLGGVLNDSGVRLAVLTACQSAMLNADDPFSGVAGRMIRSGVDAVVAMSASVLVASAARYVEALYRRVAEGTSVPEAHERARQALYADPRRHIHRRRSDEAGEQVQLQDWWLPHFYQQRELALLMKDDGGRTKDDGRKTKVKQTKGKAKAGDVSLPAEFAGVVKLPDAPRYGFGGRAYELLQAERWLGAGKLVAIAGFGGVGKTTLARELADWLVRTGMYRRALFVSFEQGGDATMLLSALGHALGVYDGGYDPADLAGAIRKLRTALRKERTLLIADNLESILVGGEAALPSAERTRLWDALLALHDNGAGLLLTSRSLDFGDGRLVPGSGVAHLHLGGLHPEDAYELAQRLLRDQGIEAARAPYAALRDLLAKLDQHPLAIQLVLPALREYRLDEIRADLTKLLPQFKDDQTGGRNRSLLASLEYSLRRLSAEQRSLLRRLAPFESGASEDDLLMITEIPEEQWATLRPALESAALIRTEKVHDHWKAPFLHFHPVLAPALRAEAGANDPALLRRYVDRYAGLANYLYSEDDRNPQPVGVLVRCELPNLRRALDLLLAEGDAERAVDMADSIVKFLNYFGMIRERDELRQRLDRALGTAQASDGLTRAIYLRESGLGEDEYSRGDLQAAYNRFSTLLARMQELPAEGPLGRGSYEYCLTLVYISRCLQDGGRPDAAETQLRAALGMIERLIERQSDVKDYVRERGIVLAVLGNVLQAQGKFILAREAYKSSEQTGKQFNDARMQGVAFSNLGALALAQGDYAEATRRYNEALMLFRSINEPASEAIIWHQLGRVAQEQRQWREAERCYRGSLEINERLGDAVSVAQICNNLAMVVNDDGRPTEAEGWYRRALAAPNLSHVYSATMLNNLASLLLNEVRAGRAAGARLAEARMHAEHALTIKETLDLSVEPWLTLNTLARIADLEGDPRAQGYRRRERETFAAFAGNRWHIDNQHAALINAIATAAGGDAAARTSIEEALPTLEQKGWKISDAVGRIWVGERDWHRLCEGIDRNSALLILRVLETLANPAAAPEVAPANDPQLFEDFDPLLRDLAAATSDESGRAELEEVLTKLEANGWRLRSATQRIWAGERDAAALTLGLDAQDKALVLRLLAFVAGGA